MCSRCSTSADPPLSPPLPSISAASCADCPPPVLAGCDALLRAVCLRSPCQRCSGCWLSGVPALVGVNDAGCWLSGVPALVGCQRCWVLALGVPASPFARSSGVNDALGAGSWGFPRSSGVNDALDPGSRGFPLPSARRGQRAGCASSHYSWLRSLLVLIMLFRVLLETYLPSRLARLHPSLVSTAPHFRTRLTRT